jgi:hypothetical protein
MATPLDFSWRRKAGRPALRATNFPVPPDRFGPALGARRRDFGFSQFYAVLRFCTNPRAFHAVPKAAPCRRTAQW